MQQDFAIQLLTWLCSAAEGYSYIARFPTRPKFSTIRLPWALFRPEAEGQPSLNPEAITNISIRYELRRPTPAAVAASARAVPTGARLPAAAAAAGAAGASSSGSPLLVRPPPQLQQQAMQQRQEQLQAAQARFERFKLEVDWIKALPAGVQPDFVLVSCSGIVRPGVETDDFTRIIAAKRRGEDHLRASGLGYTVIRPGPLVVSSSDK
jgi:hypothetical protein